MTTMPLLNPITPEQQVEPLLKAQETNLASQIPPILKAKAPKESPSQLFKDYLTTGSELFKQKSGEALNNLNQFVSTVKTIPSVFAQEPKMEIISTKVHSTLDDIIPKKEPKVDAEGNVIPPMPFEEGPIQLKSRGGVSITKQDIEALKPILFAEVSNRSADKVELESRVLLNTALNRMAEYQRKGIPMTLKEVLEQPNQYQGYGSKQYDVYKGNGSFLDTKKKEATDAIVSKLVEEMFNDSFADNIDGSVYYTHEPDGRIFAHEGSLFK